MRRLQRSHCAHHPSSSATVDPFADTKALIQRMITMLPKVFSADEKEEYIVSHQDLSSNNMMVDENHELSGIIDWECVHTVPFWYACQILKFLRGQERNNPPDLPEEFENEYYEQAYDNDMEMYEQTQLRKFFLEEMERICSEWMRAREASNIRADFAFAVDICAMCGFAPCLNRWLDSVENGEEALLLREYLGQC